MRGARSDRGHHPPSHARLRRRSGARLCRRAFRGWCSGRDHGGSLSRSLRSRRGAFRPRLWCRPRHPLRLRSHATRRSRNATPLGATARETGRTVPTIVFHADRDTTVHPSNGEYVLAQARAAAGDLRTTVEHGQAPNGGRRFTRTLYANDRGTAVLEQWVVHGGGHAWSGGSPAAPTRTRAGRMRRERCCASFSIIRTLRRELMTLHIGGRFLLNELRR